jgi:hypothetical protein
MSASVVLGGMLPPLFRQARPKHTAKRAAIAADVPYETARSWLKGRAQPSADRLLRMAAADEALANVLEYRLAAARADRAAARPGGAAALAGAAGALMPAPASGGGAA